MGKYRFVGAYTVVGDLEFKVFGSQATFSDAQFQEAVLGGGAFITEEEFDKIFQGEQEQLTKYCSINYFGAIPHELALRMEQARDVYRHYRATLVK